MRDGTFDMLVIGGGINGAVTAASLAGRGASVALVDRGDFASFTSQESSNLVWGGFKYLENYEFPLVWKLCRSRNRLMRAYPDNIKEIGFFAALDESAPYTPWFAGLGAFGYWVIGQFGTKRPRLLNRAKIEREEPVIDTSNVRGGIEYHDASSSTTTRVSCSRSCARRSRREPPPRTTWSWSRRTRGRSLGGAPPRRRLGRHVHHHGPHDRQRGRPFRRRAQRRVGPVHRTPHRVLEGHPPRRAASHDDATPQGAGVLRRHATAVLRHPDGPSIRDRHHRHPRRLAVHRSPTTTSSSCSSRSTPGWISISPCHRGDVIAERWGCVRSW